MAPINSAVVLCLNRGSSSLKFALYRASRKEPSLLFAGAIEKIDQKNPYFWIQQKKKKRKKTFRSSKKALQAIFSYIEQEGYGLPLAIGHRLVHGGSFFSRPTKLTKAHIAKLRIIQDFAPLHMPQEIALIEWIQKRYPKIMQVGCFDTSIFHTMPELAKHFSLKESWRKKGIYRYGFHGISCASILEKLSKEAVKRIVIAHLGNGASLSAFFRKKPIDTTMGLTPLGGIMMGSRPGDLDPGLLLYLLKKKRYTVSQLEKLLNEQAGLKGVSGVSEDMHVLLSSKKKQAKFAIDLFCYQATKAVGSLATTLGGIDLLVFTGGIGEKSSYVRKKICQNLGFLGMEIDTIKNRSHQTIISKPTSRCSIRVIPTEEDLLLAKHTLKEALL